MNKTKRYVRLLIALIALELIGSGCAAPAEIIPTQTRSIPQATPTVTVTLSPQNTPTQDAPFHADLSCWQTKPLQEGNDIKGSFVYANYDNKSGGKENHLFAWDISSFHSEKFNVNGDNIRDSSVSFNGDTLLMVTEKELVFLSRERTQVVSLPEEVAMKYLLIRRYLPDRRVLLAEAGWYNKGDGEYKEGKGLTYTYYIFDPKTNKISTYKLFLPNLHMDWRMVPNITYSPDMKYVLYESTPIIKGNSIVKQQFTLFDIQNNKIMWVTPSQNTNLQLFGSGPHWVPNTDVITAQYYDQSTQLYNYYFVSLDGKISPLNDLASSPGDAEILHDPSLAWSPNGRYLVSADTRYIYIWDNQTKTWNKSCLPNQFRYMNALSPVWSSDGNYFSISLVLDSTAQSIATPAGATTRPQDIIVKTFVFDLANKTIYEIPNENSNELSSLYKEGNNAFLGWVNWEIP